MFDLLSYNCCNNLALIYMNTTIVPNRAVRPVIWAWPQRIGYFLQSTGLWIPVIFLVFLFMQNPFADAGDYDYDEGINLMKTLLSEQNYKLYDDIWSDQPPLFTVLLSGWFALVGESAAAARVLVALFSALLLWSFYLSVHRSVSAFAAIGATLLLVLSQFYLRLSSAVMIGLPSLALALAAIACLVNAKQRRWPLLLSGLLMALALETKFFVVVLFPAIGLYLLWADAPKLAWSQRLGRLLLWLAVVTVAFVGLSIYFNALNIDMLLTTHFGAQTRDRVLFTISSQRFIADFFQQQPVYVTVAALGVLYALRQQTRAFLLPLAWFVTVVVAFLFHRPLWYHHIMLLTIPMAWLCAFSLEAWRKVLDQLTGQSTRQRLTQTALLATSAVALGMAIFYYPTPLNARLDEQAKLFRPLYIWEMVQQLQTDAQVKPGFVFTDRPFYAFQAGLPVTPPIAAISRKRMESGILTHADMLNALTQYKPQYVILQRFSDEDYGIEVMAEIHQNYELVLDISPGRYYRRISGS
jgi:uncharacterized membrane protein